MTENIQKGFQFSLRTLLIVVAAFAIGFVARNVADGVHPFYTGFSIPASTSPVRPGEFLSIESLSEPVLNKEAMVLADGTANLPLIGIVDIKGQTTTQIETILNKQYSKYFKGPGIQVFRIQSR